MKVSYITAAWNAEAYLLPCMESVLNQSYDNIELLVVDDGSTDSTRTIMNDMAKRDSRCRIFHQVNQGPSAARNRALAAATGELCLILDSDDLAETDRTAKQVARQEEYDLDLVVCGTKTITATGVPLKVYDFPTEHDALLKRLERRQTNFHHSSCLFRTSFLRDIGGYDPRLRQAEDADVWFRSFERGKVGGVAEPLIKLRRHSASLSHENNQCDSFLAGILVTVMHWRRREGLSDPRTFNEDNWERFRETVFKFGRSSHDFATVAARSTCHPQGLRALGELVFKYRRPDYAIRAFQHGYFGCSLAEKVHVKTRDFKEI